MGTLSGNPETRPLRPSPPMGRPAAPPPLRSSGGAAPRPGPPSPRPAPRLTALPLLPHRSSLPSYLRAAGAEPGGQRGRPSAPRGERCGCAGGGAPSAGAAGGGAASGAAGGEGGLQGNPGTAERRRGGGQGGREQPQ